MFPPPNAAEVRLKLKRVVMANVIKLTVPVFNHFNQNIWLQSLYMHKPLHSLRHYSMHSNGNLHTELSEKPHG